MNLRRQQRSSSRTRNTNQTSQRGLAMVEYLLFAPILILLILATGEFGRALMQYNGLTKALRDGARFVAENSLVNSTTVVTISATTRTRTRNLVVYGNVGGTGQPRLPGFNPNDVTVAPAGGGNVVVSANYNYQPIFASIPALVNSGSISTAFQFQAGITMRAL